MPEPALVMWILGAPFVLAIVELLRIRGAISAGRKGAPAPGPWSRALHVGS